MFALIFFLNFALFLFYNFYWKRRNLPPGPTPVPFLGNLISFYFNPKLWEIFIGWRNQYGDIYTYWFGEQPVVAVNDYETMVETFIKDGASYEGRMDEKEFFEAFGQYGNGIGMIDGSKWREQRRYALQVLRNFGMGRNLMQERILEEFTHLVNYIRTDIRNEIKEIDIVKHIDIAVGSIINNLLFGYRFDGEKSSEFYHLKHIVDRQMVLLGHPTVMIMKNHFNFFGKLPYFKTFYNEVKYNRDELYKFYCKHVHDHKRKIDFSTHTDPADFCEAYLREIKKMDEQGGEHYFTEEQLIGVVSDLWIAGQETTTTTLAFAVLFMVLYPEVQQKIQDELDRTIGSDRFITMEDKPALHFISATCQEIQRAGSIVTQNLFHRTTKDVTIKGYFLPKNTCIVPQISVVMNDEKIFPNPQEFIPERFLDSNGEYRVDQKKNWNFEDFLHLFYTLYKKMDEMCTFSLGKRVCLGESLARMEIYLFLANMCNQFKFLTIPGKVPTLKRKMGATASPYPYVVRIEERFPKHRM